METAAAPTVYDWARLFLENVSLWPVVAIAALVWLMRQPGLLDRLGRVSLGGLEVELREVKARLEESEEQISTLENELEQEREALRELPASFDPPAPVSELAGARESLKARARAMSDLSEVRAWLGPQASASELYAAAEILRERRPTEFVGDLTDCLDRLASDPALKGVRLHTVWTLTSALHRILIAAVRDGVPPPIPEATLASAEAMLDRLEANPRVQGDKPEAPDRGVRCPIRHARRWIARAPEADVRPLRPHRSADRRVAAVGRGAGRSAPRSAALEHLPTQQVEAILLGEEGRAHRRLRWGFQPRWWKSPTDGPLLINARGKPLPRSRPSGTRSGPGAA